MNRQTPHRAIEEQTLVATLTVKELAPDHKHDEYCQTAVLQVGESNSEFSIDNRDIVVWSWTVHGASQTVVQETLHPRNLYFEHHRLIAGHLGQKHT